MAVLAKTLNIDMHDVMTSSSVSKYSNMINGNTFAEIECLDDLEVGKHETYIFSIRLRSVSSHWTRKGDDTKSRKKKEKREYKTKSRMVQQLSTQFSGKKFGLFLFPI